jgi:excisionase family DNA binding protein
MYCERGETNGTVTLIAAITPMAAPLMTIEQATQALGISRSTLWRRLRSGNIQSVRRGGRLLVQLPAGRNAPHVQVTGEIPRFT